MMKKETFEQRYSKVIPEKQMAATKKMARRGKAWGWKRNYSGKFKRVE